MRRVTYYTLYLTLQGNGQVVFRLEGDNRNYSTPPLSPSDFAALAVVLAQKNLLYDPARRMFASSDVGDMLSLDSQIV